MNAKSAPFLAGTALLTAISALLLAYFNIDRGFDFTDESYYLLWVKSPQDQDMAATLFGYVLAPLYKLSGGDPAALRRLGIILSATAAIIAAALVLVVQREPAKGQDSFFALAFLLAAASTSLNYYVFWLPTPSYNWLLMPAAYLFFAAVLGVRNLGAISAGLAAAAGVLAFAAKPTTAAAFMAIYLLAIGLTLGVGRAAIRMVLMAGLATSALILALAVNVVPPQVAMDLFSTYFEFFGVQPPGGSMLVSWLAPVPYYVAVGVALVTVWVRGTVGRWLAAGGMLSLPALLLFYQYLSPAHLLAHACATAAFVAFANCICWATKPVRTSDLLLILLMALLPWPMAAGTGNEVAAQTAFHFGIPLAAALVAGLLCFGLKDWRPASLAVGVSLCSLFSLLVGSNDPYRLDAPLRDNVTALQFDGGELRVTSAMADFIKDVRHDAADAGLGANTVVLDLTGESPGIVYMLNGRAPVFPWLINGYPFSMPLLSLVVSRLTAAERDEAWLVLGDGQLAFDAQTIAALGFDLNGRYELVSEHTQPRTKASIRIYRPLLR